MTINGAGSVTLGTSNNYSGTTFVNSGLLTIVNSTIAENSVDAGPGGVGENGGSRGPVFTAGVRGGFGGFGGRSNGGIGQSAAGGTQRAVAGT